MNRVTILKALPFMLLFVGIGLVSTLQAETLSVNVVAMFPKNIAEFAYADLIAARKFPWYAQFKSQALPSRFSDLENFLASAGVDTNLQIDELVWSLGSGIDEGLPAADAVLGVAIGDFDVESAEGYMQVHKLPAVDYRNYTIYSCFSCNDTAVIFVDSNTIAFGGQQLLKRLIDVRAGADESLLQNEVLFPLITQLMGRGPFWGVLNAAGSRQAVRQMVPEVTKFPQATKPLNKLKGLAISIQGSGDVEAHFQLLASSPEDAALISQMLQVGILLRQFAARNSDPDLAALLTSVGVVPNGDGLEASIGLTSDQLVSLINRNTFSARK